MVEMRRERERARLGFIADGGGGCDGKMEMVDLGE